MRGPRLCLSSSARLLASLIGLLGAACGPTILEGGGGGAPSTSTGFTSVSSASSGVFTSVSSASSGVFTSGSTSSGVFTGCADPTPVGLPAAACTPPNPACGATSSACLATAHAHGAPSFDLRVAHLGLSAPQALMKGVVKSVFDSSTTLNLPGCNLGGGGMFNWLLHFDTIAGTLTVGAAKPVSNPATGYTFIHELLQLDNNTFPIAPVTVPASLDASCALSAGVGDVFLPIFADSSANTFTIFPVRSFRIFDTRVTPDHDCIGAYNAEGLDPANGCLPDAQHPGFIDGGHFEAFMALEDADTMLVPQLGMTLCVLLSGDASTYGEGGSPTKCKRNNGLIAFQGDWCTATNQPASGGCADAMRFAGSFAASGTKIH